MDSAYPHNLSNIRSPVLCEEELIGINCMIFVRWMTIQPTPIKTGRHPYQTLSVTTYLDTEEEEEKDIVAYKGYSYSIALCSSFHPFCLY